MKPDTTIAKEMILGANKNSVFTAEGRLVATLPPKRRCKTSADYDGANNSDSLGEKAGRPFYQLKRSGHPHQQWRTPPGFCPPTLKLPTASLLNSFGSD
jgi:hypothetical protein